MRVRWHVADHRNKVLPKVIIMLWWSFKWCWSTLNKNLLFLKDFLSLFLVTSYCWRHDLQKAYKGCVRSHCEEVSIRRRVQKYFQNIRCVLEVHHHVETMSKIDVKTWWKLSKEASKRLTASLKGTAGISAYDNDILYS